MGTVLNKHNAFVVRPQHMPRQNAHTAINAGSMDMSRASATLVSTTIQTQTQKKAQIKRMHQSPTRLVLKTTDARLQEKTHQKNKTKNLQLWERKLIAYPQLEQHKRTP